MGRGIGMSIVTALVAALMTLVATVSPLQAASLDPHHYDNQVPYGNPASSPTATPPAGYTMTFLEMLGRHGARSMTSTAPEKRALALWTSASRRGALTSTGRHFRADLVAFQKAEKKIGYGDLSGVGTTEWSGIGRRTAAAYGPFFAGLQKSQDRVDVVTSPVHRTKQSAAAMRASIAMAYPGLDYDAPTVDHDLVISSGVTAKGRKAIAAVERRASVRTAAQHVLRRLYSASFVRTVKDPVQAAMDVYLLYCTAPGMADETSVTFARYVPLADAAALGRLKDAQNFYRYGPGVKGQSSSYAQARPVLKDFLSSLRARVAGGRVAVVLRLAHGETTIPFAALIKAPGSQTQAPASTPFSYGTNPWRGYVAGRLAGSIEWTAYTNADGRVLVTMRYDEQPVPFRAACRPATADGLFYTPAELTRCLT